MRSVFIHVGYPKTATKFLSRKFFKFHPKIENFGKVDGLWDIEPDLLKSFNMIMHLKKISKKNEIEIIRCFKNLKLKKNRVNFISYEGFTQLNYVNNFDIIFRRLKKYFLKSSIKLKIIVTIRNQVEMIPTHYANAPKLYSHLKINRFKDFINKLDSKKKKLNDQFKTIFSRYKYFELYLCLLKLFGRKNLKILLLEDLRLNKKFFFKELCKFLNLKMVDENLFKEKPENVTRKRDNEFLRINKYLIKKLYNSFFFKIFLIPFPLKIRKKIYVIVANFLIDSLNIFDPIKLDDYQIQNIKKNYKIDNLKLQNVLRKNYINKYYL